MEEDGRSTTTRLMKARSITGAAAVAFVGAMLVVYNFPPTEYSFYPRCPFYAITHLLCPGCGATRALYWLLHGDLQRALHYNAMFTLAAPFILAWAFYCCYQVVRYDRIPRVLIPRSAFVAIGVAILLFTITRNTLLAF